MNQKQVPLRWILLFAPVLLVLVVIVIPFLTLVSGNFNIQFLQVLFSNSPEGILTRRAIWNSSLQGALSAVSSFAFGFPLGLFLGRYRFRFKRVISSLILVPFFLPSVTVVFAFVTGFGQNSLFSSLFHTGMGLSSGLGGIIAVNTFFNAPVVALFTMIAASRVDNSLYEASLSLSASRFGTFRKVWGKSAVLSAIGGTLLAFIYSFAGFAAPLILGGPGYYTLDAWIYSLVKTLNSFSAAVVLSLAESSILIVPALIYVYFSYRTANNESQEGTFQAERKSGDRLYTTGLVFALSWIIFELYLLSSVFIASFENRSGIYSGIANYYTLFGSKTTYAMGIWAGSSIINTLFYGTMVSLLVVTIGLMWIYGKRRNPSRYIPLTEIPQYLPLVISAIILAFAISSFFGPSTPAPFLWILIVGAQAAIAVPVVLRVLDSGFKSIPKSYSEASYLLGGTPFFDVEMPLARTAFASALMFGFAMSLGEFSATTFLATGSFLPLTVEMYALQNIRLAGAAYAAASILLAMSLASFYVIQRLGERFVTFH